MIELNKNDQERLAPPNIGGGVGGGSALAMIELNKNDEERRASPNIAGGLGGAQPPPMIELNKNDEERRAPPNRGAHDRATQNENDRNVGFCPKYARGPRPPAQ